jgi:ligand-binding sensor domain-containing protein
LSVTAQIAAPGAPEDVQGGDAEERSVPDSTEAEVVERWTFVEVENKQAPQRWIVDQAKAGLATIIDLRGIAVYGVVEKDQDVYVATSDGLFVMREDGSAHVYTIPSLPGPLEQGEAVETNVITDLLLDSRGRLWAGTPAGALQAPEKGNWRFLAPARGATAGGPLLERLMMFMGTRTVVRLLEMSSGEVVAATRSAVTIVDGDSAYTVPLTDDFRDHVTSVIEHPVGTLLASVRGRGVYEMKVRSGTCSAPQLILETDDVFSLYGAPDGALWLGTASGIRVRGPGDADRQYTEVDGLPGAFVGQILADRLGRIWAVTDSGLGVFVEGKWWVPELEPQLSRPIAVVARPDDSHAWLATSAGLAEVDLELLDLRKGLSKEQRLDAAKAAAAAGWPRVPDGQWAVRDEAGRLTMYVEGQLLRYDGQAWENLTRLCQGLPVNVLYVDRQGTVLVGTSGAGLVSIDGDTIKRYNDHHDSASVVYAIGESGDDVLWLGTQGGLYRLLADGQTALVTSDHLQVVQLLVDRRGRIWFRDPNTGLYVWDRMALRHLSGEPPLLGCRIREFIEEPDGNVAVTAWLGSDGIMQTQTCRWDATQLELQSPSLEPQKGPEPKKGP